MNFRFLLQCFYLWVFFLIGFAGCGPGLKSPGTATVASSSTPSSSVVYESIAAGDKHTCIVISGTVRCVGQDSSGELGDGAPSTTSSRFVTVTGITTANKVFSGKNHSCAILADGTVRCWGLNTNGQLGNGSTTTSTTPVTATGISSASSLALGTETTCALLTNKNVKCWGGNSAGELGNGTSTSSTTSTVSVDVTAFSANVTQLKGQSKTFCAVLSSGTVKCWGENANGHLGDGTTLDKISPVAVSGISTANAVSIGLNHACAFLNDESAKCWGDNSFGQLGTGTAGTPATSTTPVTVDVLTGRMSMIHATGDRTCATMASGDIECWGFGGQGQLGDGTTASSATAKTVSGIAQTIYQFSGNQDHTCIKLTTGNSYKCWGFNSNGQLGDGSTTTSTGPVTVIGL